MALKNVNGVLMDVIGSSGKHDLPIYDRHDLFRRHGPLDLRLAAEITRLADPNSISPALWKEIAEFLLEHCGMLHEWIDGECRSAG